jgi:hypothetical protein
MHRCQIRCFTRGENVTLMCRTYSKHPVAQVPCRHPDRPAWLPGGAVQHSRAGNMHKYTHKYACMAEYNAKCQSTIACRVALKACLHDLAILSAVAIAALRMFTHEHGSEVELTSLQPAADSVLDCCKARVSDVGKVCLPRSGRTAPKRMHIQRVSATSASANQ